MSASFKISPASAQGLYSRLENDDHFIEQNLVLVSDQSGRAWTLIDITKENVPQQGTVVRGQELVQLMRAVANTEKQFPAKFQDAQFRDLTRDAKFKGLCRFIPGVETPEHKEGRIRIRQTLGRMFESAKTVGRGLDEIEGQGQKGRYVGQNQGEQSYWIREVVFQGQHRPVTEIDILTNGWKNDPSTRLSLKEWETAKRDEWAKSGTTKEFLPWIAAESWHNEEKKAWEEAHPQDSFSEDKLNVWRATQEDPKLGLPVWKLKKMSDTTNDADFQNWRDDTIQGREENLKEFNDNTGANLSFDDFERMEIEHSRSGSIESYMRWALKQIYEGTDKKVDFTTFVRQLKWNQETQAGKTQEPFDKWCKLEEGKLHGRYIGSHLPLSFDAYRAQQDDGVLVEPAPFILLNEEERKIFHTICDQGRLERNGHPFDTQFEKTLHSGNGYAIFVIGPKADLYCSSHISGVFHHSSFLGDGAIMAAGEIKTRPDGSIEELSSKSGHYRPTDAENLFMLRYFRDRGVDLTHMKFTFYDSKGKTEERNALQYLDELEKGRMP